MQSNPIISFVIVNRNTSHLLLQCIGHIQASDPPVKSEIILVDNGSTDDSVSQIRSRYPDVHIIEAGRNLGFAAANNRALSVAKGEILLLVNTDALLEADCAAKLLNVMKSDSHVGMIGPQLLNADGTNQNSFEAMPDIMTETLNRSLLKRILPKKYPGKKTAPNCIEVPSLIGAVMMIRKDLLVKLGGFDEGYFFFFEETDLALRIRQAGFKVMHEPQAKAIHLQGATAGSYRPEARIEFYRSRYTFFNKHYGPVHAGVLKTVVFVNLVLSSAGMNLANIATLRKSERLNSRLETANRLLKWHIRGCPGHWGLPRT